MVRQLSRFAPILIFLIGGCGPPPPTFVERKSLAGHSAEVVALAFSPDGQTLASRGSDAVKVWEMIHDREPITLPSDGSDFGSLAFAPDGKTLATDKVGVGAVAYDLTTGREQATYHFPSIRADTPGRSATPGWGLAYSPDGKTLAGGGGHSGEDGYLTLWDRSTGDGVASSSFRGPITTVAYSRDGRTVVTGGMRGKMVLWDAATNHERVVIEANRSYLAPIALSPDGRVIATTNEARWVTLWDVENGKSLGTLKGHLKAILALAFSPDGRSLVSADSGATLFVWDLASRKVLTRVESKDRGKVWGLAFSPDGQTLATAGEDRLIHLWDVRGLISTQDR